MAIARMPIGLFMEGVRARVAVERATASQIYGLNLGNVII